ncbi:MAG: NYN domain-containing protein [candidate division NC10 bacterium]|jgi:predicted RNA-binding protein with PIN domain
MRWLVDGYNVIRREPGLSAREQVGLQVGRHALCQLLLAAARASGDQFTIVFDGTRGGGSAFSSRGVRVVFSKEPERADHLIARLATPGVAVVSNDRDVRQAADRAGAIAITSDEFLARVLAPPTPDEDEEDDPDPVPKKGNPRRLPKKARAAKRALKRLDQDRKRSS